MHTPESGQTQPSQNNNDMYRHCLSEAPGVFRCYFKFCNSDYWIVSIVWCAWIENSESFQQHRQRLVPIGISGCVRYLWCSIIQNNYFNISPNHEHDVIFIKTDKIYFICLSSYTVHPSISAFHISSLSIRTPAPASSPAPSAVRNWWLLSSSVDSLDPPTVSSVETSPWSPRVVPEYWESICCMVDTFHQQRTRLLVRPATDRSRRHRWDRRCRSIRRRVPTSWRDDEARTSRRPLLTWKGKRRIWVRIGCERRLLSSGEWTDLSWWSQDLWKTGTVVVNYSCVYIIKFYYLLSTVWCHPSNTIVGVRCHCFRACDATILTKIVTIYSMTGCWHDTWFICNRFLFFFNGVGTSGRWAWLPVPGCQLSPDTQCEFLKIHH